MRVIKAKVRAFIQFHHELIADVFNVRLYALMIPLDELERGIRMYHDETARRSYAERERDRLFQAVPMRFASRQPPRFNRGDLEEIISWKYTDARRRKTALLGLSALTDVTIEQATAVISGLSDPTAASRLLTGVFPGVGIAGVSAILYAAHPLSFPVIDMFALVALEHFEAPAWIVPLPRDNKGRPQADTSSYAPYTFYCGERAEAAHVESGKIWTIREVYMGLWGLGKSLPD
jgi:hypothetical protein